MLLDGASSHHRYAEVVAAERDLFDQIRDTLLFEASRRRSLQWGKRPNARAITRAMGNKVDKTTVQRILNGQRNLSPDGATREYRPSAELEDGLMLLLGVESRTDLYAALSKTPRLRTVSRRAH